MPNAKKIPMREVRERTDLTSRQIRYYDQLNLIFPERTSGNQRLFSEDDIKRLLKIKELIKQGYAIDKIREKIKPPLSKNKSIKENKTYTEPMKEEKYFRGDRLNSLYPVSDRSTLIRKLDARKKDKKKEEESN